MPKHFRSCDSTRKIFGLQGERFYSLTAIYMFFMLFRFLISPRSSWFVPFIERNIHVAAKWPLELVSWVLLD